MALTDQQQAELEAEGIRNVTLKLLVDVGGARNRPVGSGFASGDKMLRGDVEDWLAANERAERAQQSETLRWAKIAGWAALAAVGIGIVVPLLQWLLAK